jgi:KTSC domain
MSPTMRSVESSSIAAVGYDRQRRQAYIRFKTSPRLYLYEGVPAHVFEELERAESKGAFVNEVIKPRFRVRKL